MAVDASAAAASIALFAGSECVAYACHVGAHEHGEWLVHAIDHAAETAGITAQDIGCWLVGVGPGSFTGVRVAVATVKGICLVTRAPVAAVTSLEALFAHGHAQTPEHGQSGITVCGIDAGRGDLYVQAFGQGGVPFASPVMVSRATLHALRHALGLCGGEGVSSGSAPAPFQDGSPLLLIGSALAPLANELAQALGAADPVVLSAPEVSVPDARYFFRFFAERPREPADRLVPIYVRPPDITTPKPKAAPPTAGAAP